MCVSGGDASSCVRCDFAFDVQAHALFFTYCVDPPSPFSLMVGQPLLPPLNSVPLEVGRNSVFLKML